MAVKKTPATTSASARARRTPVVPAPTIPGWIPVAAYALVTLVLFREMFSTSLLGTDTVALSYFARNFYTEFVQQFGRMPYWNPLVLGGLPFVEGMHGDIFYPPSLALFFLDARAMWGFKMALHVFLAGVFTYLFLRRGLKLDRLPAFFGGLVYMMGADLVSLVVPGGDGKLFVSALAPLVFWLAERAVSGRRISDFAIFALGIALILFTSHMQAAYYCVWGVSLYFFFRVGQAWRAERSGARAASLVGAYALAGLLGVAAAAVQFLPPLEYLREHSHRVDRQEERGYEWSSTYSLHAEEIASLVVPNFVGDVGRRPGSQAYWGKNGFKLNLEYAGLVPLLLIPLLLLRRRTPHVWFFFTLAALTLLYALANSTPFGRLFYLIPGVQLFRAWSIIIFLYGFAIATLGALGAQALQDWLTQGRADDSDAAVKTLWITAGVFGALALLASSGALLGVVQGANGQPVGTGLWTALFHRAMQPGSAAALAGSLDYITLGFWIAFALALAVAGTWHLAAKGMLSARASLLLLVFWAAADQYRASRPFVATAASMNEPAYLRTLTTPDDVIASLQRLRDAGGVFRVFDMSGPLQVQSPYNDNDFAIHGLEQMYGHHGNEMSRYRNLIGGEQPTNVTEDLKLLDVTNTEYVVIPGRFEHPSLEEVYAGQQAVVYRNRNALPRAYLVGGTEVVPAEQAIARLLSPDFDARSIALLDEPLPQGVDVQPGITGAVEWVSRGMDHHTLRVAPDRPGLLIVLDNWYPEWKATVNGRDVPVLRANHTFRAIPVAAGEQTVELRYEPARLRTGVLISLAVLALLLGAIALDVLRRRRAAAAPAAA